MEIRYVKNKDIDKGLWDACISKSFNAIIYAYSWYLDVVCPDWDALIAGSYEAVFPINHGKKFGIDYVFQPCFSAQLGLFSVSKLSPDVVNQFLNKIPDRFKLVEMNLNTYNTATSPNFNYITNSVYELELIQNYQNIYRGYSENTKRNLKKAVKAELTYQRNVQPSLIIELFRSNRGKDIKSLSDNDYKRLQNLINILIQKKKAEVWGAYDTSNKLCCGIFFAGSNNKAMFLFSGANSKALETGAMPYLIDRFIEQNAQEHLVLDFCGSNDPNLARFYAGFGSRESNYQGIRRNTLPWPLRLLKK